jgi:adenine-specific DNA-methyltransferase
MDTPSGLRYHGGTSHSFSAGGHFVGKKKAARVTESQEQSAQSYNHPEAKVLVRPEVGTQAQFKKRKEPRTYRYDSSLSPELSWDGQNSAREKGEALLAKIQNAKTLEEAQAAAAELAAIQKPFLNWSGKAERLSFDCPSLPLFIHERLSTQAIIETLTGHRKRKETQATLWDLYNDPQLSVTEQTLRAYEHPDKWSNRMVLGDSLAVMNSLLAYEHLGGQVQMIYMDPPYGVKFGSNFQPFVRKRDVSHGDDEDMTREPEMVQAYRDTWELGLHSYLTYPRDRLLLCRDLLTPSGSIFVQISDENLHHVRQVMDEVFGVANFVGQIAFQKTGATSDDLIGENHDYLIWFAKDIENVRFRRLFQRRSDQPGIERYDQADEDDRAYRLVSLLSDGARTGSSGMPFTFEGKVFEPKGGTHWSVTLDGLGRIASQGRVVVTGKTLQFKKYDDDFSYVPIGNIWRGLMIGKEKMYAVQTSAAVVQRCMMMTTDPGDLVLDPTCGSGTTAYVAEQWGRRWITVDTSRVPLALARQRLLTATFPWYDLKDPDRGPAGGFVYQRRQNKKGEEVGGIVPHITLKSIANNEPPQEEVLVDRPEVVSGITRVAGAFCFEASIPPAAGEESGVRCQVSGDSFSSHVERMIEILRKSPLLRLDGGKSVLLKNIRPPAKSLSLSAEAQVDANGKDPHPSPLPEGEGARHSGKPVAIVIGPENGPVSSRLVEHAAREAAGKSYSHLYVIGFAIEAKAREAIEHCESVFDIPATYVQATPDLLMGDLLKNMRSSQIFSVCGLPEIQVKSVECKVQSGKKKEAEEPRFQVELLGLDVFDPVTMENQSRTGNDVPAWFLDTDYNGLCFHVSQAFFPRTSAWDNLKKALKGQFDETVWDHLAGTISAPFEAGDHRTVAVKVIDDRGNELLVVKELK